jgi:hypothetical protein
MKKHATKDGNQQKLQTLGEFTSGNRFLSETGIFPCTTLAFIIGERVSNVRSRCSTTFMHGCGLSRLATYTRYKILHSFPMHLLKYNPFYTIFIQR